MSVWNSVLQATHSALIDELNSCFPDDKLELGLPKRVQGWQPSPNGEIFLLRKIDSPEGAGIVALGTLKSQPPTETQKIWEGAIKRATKEFHLRKIGAQFGDELTDAPKLAMVIWLPIRIPTLKTNPVYDLAAGV